MPKVTLQVLVALVVGIATGAIGLWLLTRPQERALALAPTTSPDGASLKDKQYDGVTQPPDAPNANQPFEVKTTRWTPTLGETCHLVCEPSLALTVDETRLYLIPRDGTALARLLKYGRARDGSGFEELINERRCVWIESQKNDVTLLDLNTAIGFAEVRVHAQAYEPMDPFGAISKKGRQMLANRVEAVIPVQWLHPGRAPWNP